ncbi:hypothetical protein PAXRUDRAFT_145837 [Paxillus rubicundulus Ve08.2h10]|uniref:Sacsin/Nov domain-containing protein n=1 Tax=Paxillus rubicundulus Ve08.2h10 TaxID=930991 RepID=A0A0D0E083_9AGAM|nr:hypothetical protein PAXRUDRAFT_145837 [Paxillus rubicundulus Ve08.2h10]
MNIHYSGTPTKVNVNQRDLVEKVLARYPEDLTVFRELVQNADDARAENVEIDFQTKDYAAKASGSKAMNGTNSDLTSAKIHKWVVRNDGDKFKQEDWDRLTNIAVGNPDDQKIGAFGVGFFSVFSVTDSPVIISGDRCMKMYYNEDQLMVQHGNCEASEWATIEMEVKDEKLPMPKPFDLSRFLCTAVTFLVKVKRVTITFNGQFLSGITRTPRVVRAIDLPEGLKNKRDNGFMQVQSVQMISQEVRVTLTGGVYSAGSKRTPANRPVVEQQDPNPVKRPGFFETLRKKPEPHRATTISRTLSHTTESTVNYTIYSAKITSTPSKDIVRGLEAATKKKPPASFLYEAVHFSRDEYQRVMQDGKEEGSIGSVFRGIQGLCSEEGEGHGARLFVGQRTAQTSGSAIHLSSRFIPTVERGSIDLVYGNYTKWNDELLYVGGLLTRLIYEQAMKDIRSRWSEPSSLSVDRLREEALYTMQCFTFQQSTPDLKVGELLQDTFYNCSASRYLPILSNTGIRNSKEVREPHADFLPFMKARPILDSTWWPAKSPMIQQLPEEYRVKVYTFQDVRDELKGRAFTEEEMIACMRWWVKIAGTTQQSDTSWKKDFLADARFYSPTKLLIELSKITKFVDPSLGFSFLQDDDPLPPDTIPLSLTKTLQPNQLRTALGWQQLSIVDWIHHLTTSDLHHSKDIRKDAHFSQRILLALNNTWPSLEFEDKAKIISLLQDVDCVPTKNGHRKPKDTYFPEADLFDEMVVVQLPLRVDSVLIALGVRRYVEWEDVEHRLDSLNYSMMRLVAYLQAVRPHMKDKFKKVSTLRIFASDTGTRHCIQELYYSDPINLTLGLPVLRWGDEPGLGIGAPTSYDVAAEFLFGVGLQRYPSLEIIIKKASADDPEVRQCAYNFFVNHLEDYYAKYNPVHFADCVFLPCGNGDQPEYGTPEQVLTSCDWEILGFRTIHTTVPHKLRARLKLKERPSGAAIIKAMKRNPPNKTTARKWFELASSGGFSAVELAEISRMPIVPVQRPLDGTNLPEGADPPAVSPSKCFYERPDAANMHHVAVFTYVEYGQTANEFLKMCGAKPQPDCSDIVQAMVDNPQVYLNRLEGRLGEAHAYKKRGHLFAFPGSLVYLDDLRQVAAGYHSFSKDLRERIRRTAMFIAFRKGRTPGAPVGGEPKDYALKCAREVLIADDLESHRLFGGVIFVAPKEEVFENFYREHGSETLSARVDHEVQPGTPMNSPGEEDELRKLVLERVRIFIHDQDSTRRSDFDILRWENKSAFTVKYCKTLEISKSLHFEFVTRSPAPIREEALAGIRRAEENDTLWVKQLAKNSKEDWYDVAVALCRVIFKTHKTHDTLLLMTILDADLQDLERRGYDVEAIKDNFEMRAKRLDETPAQPPKPEDRQARKGEGNVPKPSSSPPPPPIRTTTRTTTATRTTRTTTFFFDRVKESMKDLVKDLFNGSSKSGKVVPGEGEMGKKLRNMKYCNSCQTHLEPWENPTTREGMPVFKARNSDDLPKEHLEKFSSILEDLRKLFDLEAAQLHIFWKPNDVGLMGFNRNKAIYLNLAHYRDKHAPLPENEDSRATTYAAWYFIIAHEIAHNKNFFHDEDHERLFSWIAQSRLIHFKQLLENKAPNAVATSITDSNCRCS